MTVGSAAGENRYSIHRVYPAVAIVAGPDRPTSVKSSPTMARSTARARSATGTARMAAAAATAQPAILSGVRQP